MVSKNANFATIPDRGLYSSNRSTPAKNSKSLVTQTNLIKNNHILTNDEFEREFVSVLPELGEIVRGESGRAQAERLRLLNHHPGGSGGQRARRVCLYPEEIQTPLVEYLFTVSLPLGRSLLVCALF
jgi:hypothetical protein